MSRLRMPPERHLVERIGWLRAAVLGANDGIVSTASLTFATGAAMPSIMVVLSPPGALVASVSAGSLGFLARLGAAGAWPGGAAVLRATARVTFWGALAMLVTSGIAKLFGAVA